MNIIVRKLTTYIRHIETNKMLTLLIFKLIILNESTLTK